MKEHLYAALQARIQVAIASLKVNNRQLLEWMEQIQKQPQKQRQGHQILVNVVFSQVLMCCFFSSHHT